MTNAYIYLKNAEENEILYNYLKQNNYKNLTLVLKKGTACVTSVNPDRKTYFCSWSNSSMLNTISKDYKVVTLRQFILRQEGRILL